MRTEFLCVSVLRETSGPRVKVASCKSALNPRWFTLLTHRFFFFFFFFFFVLFCIKGKRKVHGVPQSQTAALPKHQEEEEIDKSKQAQIDQTYDKH